MWYLKACRSCLTTTGLFERIRPQARRLFNAITDLELQEGDGLPQYFCAECYVQIKKALQFRRRSRRAHFVLKEILTIKQQVGQGDVEKINRIKTNLISPYSIWKPETAAAYTYITPDAIEKPPKVFLSNLETQAALADTTKDLDLNINCNDEANALNIYTNTEDDEKNGEYEEGTPKTDELSKLELKTINSSLILVDIKPDNWREIEKEEEERVQRERQAEIDAELHEINEDGAVDDAMVIDDVLPEDIDLEDVFKGLIEASERESESEIELPTSQTETEKQSKRKCKATSTKTKLQILASRKSTKDILAVALPRVQIQYLTLDEQKEEYRNKLNVPSFKQALFKCAICLTVYGSVEVLYKHVAYHNRRTSLEFACDVCKDRFASREELDQHGSLVHWYEYSCSKCESKHYSLDSLLKCFEYEDSDDLDDFTTGSFIVRPIRPHHMYKTLNMWSGDMKDPYKCRQCKIAFSSVPSLIRHQKKHVTPPADSDCYTCDICALSFEERALLVRHMRRWHLYLYTCITCNKRFRNRCQANTHFKSGCNNNVCRICQKKFIFKTQLEAHMNLAHRVDCNMCGFPFMFVNKLYLHQISVHGLLRLNTEPALNDPRLHCALCNVHFVSERALFRHLARLKHEGLPIYEKSCVPCKIMFPSDKEAQEHKEFCMKSYPSKCPTSECPEVLPDHRSSVIHGKAMHKQKPAHDSRYRLCEICGKMVTKFAAHTQTHAELEGTIHCTFCAHKSGTEQAHVSHVLFNHTDKPYCCTLCSRRFSSRTACRDHILKHHAPVRPYACASCARQFAHLDYLSEHCRKAHGVDLKQGDRSVYLPKRMFGKIYTYPHMKMDGSLIDMNILKRTPVELCDYMDENNAPIDYKIAFFFDPLVDPAMPTRVAPPLKRKMKSVPLQQILYRRKIDRERKSIQRKNKSLARKTNRDGDNVDHQQTEDKDVKLDTYEDIVKRTLFGVEDTKQDGDQVNVDDDKNVIKNKRGKIKEKNTKITIKLDNVDTAQKNVGNVEVRLNESTELDMLTIDEYVRDEEEYVRDEEVVDGSASNSNEETASTEEVAGQLIERDGQYYVVVDDVLYSLADDYVEALKQQGAI